MENSEKPTKEALIAFIEQEFPQANCHIQTVGNQQAVISHEIGFDELRPGGTVSGPVLMKVADVALYVAILGEIGIVALAVTTSLTINFLRKPTSDARIIGKSKLIKVGRTLVVGEVYLYSEGKDEPVAHVIGTYALPQSA